MPLSDKFEVERSFHDCAADGVDVATIPVGELFEAPTSPEPRWILRQFGDVSGKRVLDLGCGAGEASVYLARLGARVTALDISPGMCHTAEELARFHGVGDRMSVVCAPAEEAGLAAESFDFVFGYGVLHHTDIPSTARAVERLLAPRGLAAFVEPLAYNPAINVYRKMAAGVRTPTERPLDRGDFEALREVFPGLRHREFQLATLATFVWMYAIERLDPSQVRYWKRIVSESDRYASAFKALSAVDRAALALVPPLRWWCWNTALVCPRR